MGIFIYVNYNVLIKVNYIILVCIIKRLYMIDSNYVKALQSRRLLLV